MKDELKFDFKVENGMGVIAVNGIELPVPFTDQAAVIKMVDHLVGRTLIPFSEMADLKSAIQSSALPATHADYVREQTGSKNEDFVSGVVKAGENSAYMPRYAIMTTAETSATFSNKAAARTVIANMNFDDGEYKHILEVVNQHPTMPESIKDAIQAVTRETGDLGCGVVQVQEFPHPGWVIITEYGRVTPPFALRAEVDRMLAPMIHDGHIRTKDESLQIQKALDKLTIPVSVDDMLRMALKLEPEADLTCGVVPGKDGAYHFVIFSKTGKKGFGPEFFNKDDGLMQLHRFVAGKQIELPEWGKLAEQVQSMDILDKPDGDDSKTGVMTMMVDHSWNPVGGFSNKVFLNGDEITDQRIIDLLEWATDEMTGDGQMMTLGLGGSHGLPRGIMELLSDPVRLITSGRRLFKE